MPQSELSQIKQNFIAHHSRFNSFKPKKVKKTMNTKINTKTDQINAHNKTTMPSQPSQHKHKTKDSQ